MLLRAGFNEKLVFDTELAFYEISATSEHLLVQIEPYSGVKSTSCVSGR